ncbi:hypothetical protein DFH27DRAFT_534295 [Peziza echinospora]|nr:hypothetical protein DFH27DRAFT_534295 [Peziza echinospora]
MALQQPGDGAAVVARIPLKERKWDLFYFAWFCHMVPIMLFVDTAAFIPPHLRPYPQHLLHTFYLTTYSDPLALAKPLWFTCFSVSEFLIQLPIGLWSLPALYRGDKLVPLWVGVYAGIAALTTWVSVAEIVGWDGRGNGYVDVKSGEERVWFSESQRWQLVGMFAGYGVVFTVMLVDMLLRIKRSLEISAAVVEGKKKRV